MPTTEQIYSYGTLDKIPDNYDSFIFKAKGYCEFFSTQYGINIEFFDEDYYRNKFNNLDESKINYYLNDFYEREFTHMIFDKINGLDFLQSVQDGGFIDYDGTLCNIYVNGYISNLGLKEKGINQGKFKVTGEVFEDLCKSYDIWVNWANK